MLQVVDTVSGPQTRLAQAAAAASDALRPCLTHALKQYEPKPGQAQVHVTLTVLLFNKANMP